MEPGRSILRPCLALKNDPDLIERTRGQIDVTNPVIEAPAALPLPIRAFYIGVELHEQAPIRRGLRLPLALLLAARSAEALRNEQAFTPHVVLDKLRMAEEMVVV